MPTEPTTAPTMPTMPPTKDPNAVCYDEEDCSNNGYCAGSISNGEGFCMCKEGYGGTNCEMNMGSCPNLQCINGGVPNAPACTYCTGCDQGWCGAKCDYMCGSQCGQPGVCP